MKYYVLGVWGDVEPRLYGPFDTEEERDSEARRIKKSDELDEGGIYRLGVDNGVLFVESYSGIELDPNEDG
jgi:hypothetical protein